MDEILFMRQDIINLARKYAVRNEDSYLEKDYSSFTQSNEAKSKYGGIVELDADEVIVETKCPITGKELDYPSRGRNCVHFECMCFEDIFSFILIKK